MNKVLLSLVFLAAAGVAGAQNIPPAGDHPVFGQTRPPLPPAAEDKRFQAVENTGGTGFYWLDTTNGNLWKLRTDTIEWVFIGTPRGADTGRRGTYRLLSDHIGGAYVLHTETGEGWWTDGTVWQIIGEPVRSSKQTN